MPSLSKHIIFLLDVSDSMAGTKLEHAKQSVEIMLEGLDESRDYVNLFVFDNDTRPVVPAGLGNHSQYDWKWPKEAFQCTNETRDDLMSFLDENHSAEVAKVSNPANVANITLAIETAINAEDFVRHSVPDNALTMIVLITDGRSGLTTNASFCIYFFICCLEGKFSGNSLSPCRALRKPPHQPSRWVQS